MQLYLESYNDEQGQRMAERVFHNVMGRNTKLSTIGRIVSDYDKVINFEGRTFIEENYPFLLNLKDLKEQPIRIEGFGRPIHQSAIVHNELIHGVSRSKGGHPLTALVGGNAFNYKAAEPVKRGAGRLMGSGVNYPISLL